MGVKEELRSLIVWNPNIQLRQGEVCFFFSKVQYGTPHLETTTKVKPGIGLGVVVPVTKHFGLGLGKRKVKTEISTQKVWDKESCELYVMDDRIALKFKCGVMDIDLGTVTNLKVNKDADTAISQILRKDYPAKLREYSDQLLLLGINYDRETKQHSCRIIKSIGQQAIP